MFLFQKTQCLCELVCLKAPFNRLDLRPKGYKREALPWSAIRRPCTSRVSCVPVPLSRRGSKRVVIPGTDSSRLRWALRDSERVDS